MKCPKCGSRDIDFQEAGGQSICVSCGTVLEENTIVSSIEFQETGDRSQVIGQFVSANCSKPFSSMGRGMGRHSDSRDSRDATLVNARRAISQVASVLRLPPLYIDRAYRLYQLALQRNFTFGRKQNHVVATCLYIICRQERSPHLLIDFSDALQINVYVLGKSFLQFAKVLTLNLPVVDPSLYIHRYATRLELGEQVNSVVTASLRIITRLKKDWISTGRRPDGICAVALLIAARSHGFDLSQQDVSKLFRVSTDLLRRRLEEFCLTPSAQLTLTQFQRNDMEQEFDPPAFVRAQLALMEADEHKHIQVALPGLQGTLDEEESERGSEGVQQKTLIGEVVVNVAIPGALNGIRKDTKIRERHGARKELYEELYAAALDSPDADEAQKEALLLEAQQLDEESGVAIGGWGNTRKMTPCPPQFTNSTSNTTNTSTAPTGSEESGENSTAVAAIECNEEQVILGENHQTSILQDSTAVDSVNSQTKPKTKKKRKVVVIVTTPAPYQDPTPVQDSSSLGNTASRTTVNPTLPAVRTTDLTPQTENTPEGGELAPEGGEVKPEQELELEWDKYILSQEEQQKRCLIWEKAFRPFMDERARRKQIKEEAPVRGTGPGGRKKYTRRHVLDENTTTSSAVLAAGGSSRKINYEALKGVFAGNGNFAPPDPSSGKRRRATEILYPFDNTVDGDFPVVVEEEVVKKSRRPRKVVSSLTTPAPSAFPAPMAPPLPRAPVPSKMVVSVAQEETGPAEGTGQEEFEEEEEEEETLLHEAQEAPDYDDYDYDDEYY